MNKQDAIERIKKISEYPATYPCAIVRTPNAIEVIKSINEPQINDEQAWNKIAEAYPETVQSLRITLDHAVFGHKDELQKVKVPAFVAEKMKRYKSALWMLSSEYFDTSSEVDSDELANWIDQNSETFFRAWLDGYEVEEEPKYRVNIGGLYLKEPLADTNDFTISMTWNKDYAYPFDSWNMAREHTSELGGTVEKV
ncbi:DUF1642 domain-containing protein [Enterococcus hulanensis]|uniref:DUF1642 domain-containing protein n=1 Tax=Enterococcus hulanensis TaxID=2559929 RepID=A0ABU3EXR2_9ENTE|nr:DUF1642 domain-containing protein [Enterococcus hulanensis]MDT2599462.1 DUF1642 domain-containing protein [Enterococcus hulanensis]MDT2608869.1 DUF1642 domain-containing protein [Enterococcus hulanensis]MDT2616624.1 DUF1642 domain-containing protein [Enterococcus hulanensis]MDT2627336.1 DUF1642 domain-containing protein [Enterococcus hulanensis]MDT2657202.1 DUF1642 domain-containing protein [Enterococcus hulanensis]